FEAPPPEWLAELRRLEAVSLHCDAVLLSDEVLAEARAHDIPVLCYTVNAPEQAKTLFARGVSALFTDRLDLFAQ
ncbi:MAG: glycerophosphodiester phosphodiesterase family protein, partial [Azonexus sp.]